jgi:hypothetical protein
MKCHSVAEPPWVDESPAQRVLYGRGGRICILDEDDDPFAPFDPVRVTVLVRHDRRFRKDKTLASRSEIMEKPQEFVFVTDRACGSGGTKKKLYTEVRIKKLEEDSVESKRQSTRVQIRC